MDFTKDPKAKCDQQNQINLSHEEDQEIHIEDAEQRGATGSIRDERLPIDVSGQVM